MSKTNSFARIAIFALAVLSLPIASFAQLSLRKAMDNDGDGKADYSIFRPETGTWWILKSNGGAIVQQWGSANDDYLTPGDFDGDGTGDIAIWRDTNGAWFILESSTSTMKIYNWGTANDTPVARDYNNDGKTDPAVVRSTNGSLYWWVLMSTTTGHNPSATQWGSDSDFLAPGDYFGDASFDFAIQRPGSNGSSAFWVLSSAGVNVVEWGANTDIVVPGDYDGDGKTDVAVVREGAADTDQLLWYIRRSSNGTLMGFSFGATGTDLTAQNDYDGDGRTEVAIWRTTDGNFWSINTNTNVVTVVNWGATGDQPVANYDVH